MLCWIYCVRMIITIRKLRTKKVSIIMTIILEYCFIFVWCCLCIYIHVLCCPSHNPTRLVLSLILIYSNKPIFSIVTINATYIWIGCYINKSRLLKFIWIQANFSYPSNGFIHKIFPALTCFYLIYCLRKSKASCMYW